MPSTPTPNPPTALREGRPWFGFGVHAALVAVETCLLVACFGTVLESVFLKFIGYASFDRWKILALAGVSAAYLIGHVRNRPISYRTLRLSPPRVAMNAVMFTALLACLGAISMGQAGALVGEKVSLLVAAALTIAWSASALALWMPRREFVLQIAGGLGFLATVAWLSSRLGRFAETFWDATGGTTVTMVEWLLRPLAGDEVICPEPFVIGTRSFRVFIGAPCSGYQGIGLITGLLVGYLWWFRRIHRFPQSFLLVPVGVVLIWLANSVRIATLILVGIWISPDIAVDGFHAQAGWIAFLIVGLGIIWAAQTIPFFTIQPGHSDRSPPTGPLAAPAIGGGIVDDGAGVAAGTLHGPSTTACLLPFLGLTGVTILTGAFTSGFDLFYPLRVITVAATLVLLRRQFPLESRPGPLVSPGAIGIGFGVFLIWMALAPGAEAATEEKLLAMDPTNLGEPWTTLWLLVRVVGSVITVPIAEELAFRGFLIRRCIAEDVDTVPVGTFTWLSFLASSLAFGILHGGAWIAGTVAGMAFAAALYQRRRIIDAVAAHATTNALLSAYVIGTGSWTQWG